MTAEFARRLAGHPVEGCRRGGCFTTWPGGQRLFIVPELDLVVIVMAGIYDNPVLNPFPEGSS